MEPLSECLALDTLNQTLRERPLSASLRYSIEADWEIAHTYNSNAIEGNTLTLAETKAVLLHGVTVSGKPLREHLEATNHRDAWRQMRVLAGSQVPLTENDILALHRTILTGIQSDEAGRYRRDRVRIAGSSLILPNPLRVPDLMSQWATGLSRIDGHPVLHAARMHYHFVAIHPFIDGNGRTARLLMNLLLLRAGYPAALIPVSARAEYYATLEDANHGDLRPFEHFIACRVREGILDLLALTED